MARLPRLKIENEVGWYHICTRMAGWVHWFPFQDPIARRKLYQVLRRYLSVYRCDTAAFSLMGNHLILRFAPFQALSREEPYRRARRLYRNPDQQFRTEQDWERFNRRLFNVSELMRNVQMKYALWYNRRFDRRGSFWGERFKSVILGDEQSILDTLLYVEFNPVRAGLVERPEDWTWGSATLRAEGRDGWLLDLAELIPEAELGAALPDYRARLYYRGATVTKVGTHPIPPRILEQEQSRGFRMPGLYRKRIRALTDGLFIGTQIQVGDWITTLQRPGRYLRRRHPILQKIGEHPFYTLREQRRRRIPPEKSYPASLPGGVKQPPPQLSEG